MGRELAPNCGSKPPPDFVDIEGQTITNSPFYDSTNIILRHKETKFNNRVIIYKISIENIMSNKFTLLLPDCINNTTL